MKKNASARLIDLSSTTAGHAALGITDILYAGSFHTPERIQLEDPEVPSNSEIL